MFLKTAAGIFVVMWVRWTLPRFRYDQLMAMGWKFMIPLALGYIVVTTLAIALIEAVLPGASALIHQLLLFVVNLGLAWLVFWVADRGFVMAGGHHVAPEDLSLEGAPGARGRH